jgi:hypothetical protein
MSILYENLRSGTVVLITGGTHVGHTATILSATKKMYHIRLDNTIVTRVKKTNVQTLEAPPQQNFRSASNSLPATDCPVYHAEASSIVSDSNHSASHLNPRDLARQAERLECERKIAEALEEIHRQATIVAELTEQIKLLDLANDTHP